MWGTRGSAPTISRCRPDGSHYNSACSAALITPQWIITAAHCFTTSTAIRSAGRSRTTRPPRSAVPTAQTPTGT
ncbi:MAG: hypothetical protein DLM59_00390 [Pseudonocardiales bacterium]|nr:MAG: hypothetical protein DLM59_00390 [Pseudonocardiales bacterium]